MSSWKKAAKVGQRKYQERHQPEARNHLGLLEKKKDYKRRANDYNKKALRLKKLHKKALNKNPDEFYFHMVNSVVENGTHHDIEKEDEDTPDQIKLMQTQDLRYITMKRTIEANSIAALQAKLHALDAANSTQNSHIFFVDSKSEAKKINVAQRLDTHPELVANRVNRMRLSDLEQLELGEIDKKTAKIISVRKKKMYAQLVKRIERERELGVIQQKLEMKKNLSAVGSSRPKKVKAATKSSAPVYFWDYERKR